MHSLYFCEVIMKEDKKDKIIRLLNNEITRLEEENELLKNENLQLKNKIDDIENNERTKIIENYEQELRTQIEQMKKLKQLYEQLLDKQRKYIYKEKSKYRKATNKAISDFTGSLS